MSDYMPPAPQESEDQGSYAPWLDPSEVEKPTKARILGVRQTPDAQFSDFALDVQVNGKKRTIGIKLNSPNHRILAETLGRKWVGKTVTAHSRFSKQYNKDYVILVDPKRVDKGRGKK